MTITIGSARIADNGKITGGKVGDQKQTSTSDYKGEVSMQTFYVDRRGWYILRPKSIEHANKIAERMKAACNNKNLGYDQSNRLGIIKYGIDTKTPTECDCSSTARACVKEATGKDPGNFTTANEAAVLMATGLFTKISYVSQAKTPVYNGDVLVTKTKGHTVIVVSGRPRKASTTTTKKKTATDAAKHKKSSLAGTYETTAELNVRNGAGTKKSIMVTIPKGTAVKNYGFYSNSKGRKWLYVQFTYKGVVYTGFCSGKYLKKA
jgi:hypothetical protein